MEAATLKGTQDGYEIILNDQAAMNAAFETLEKILDGLKTQMATSDKYITFDIITGNRLLTSAQRQRLENLFANYQLFSIHKVISNVITKEKAQRMKDLENVHILDRVIRNGQEVNVEGDVLFLGQIHQGGKLFVSGNIFVMGTIEGIIQAGFPNIESKFIIGDIQTAQQVRIGEQFEILDDSTRSKIKTNTVIYVDDLHTLAFGELEDLKQISPKFFNQIGGTING